LLGDSDSGFYLEERIKNYKRTKTNKKFYSNKNFISMQTRMISCTNHDWTLSQPVYDSGTSDLSMFYSIKVFWQRIVNPYDSSTSLETNYSSYGCTTNDWVWTGGGDATPPKPEFSPIVLKRAERLLDRLLTSRQRKYWDRNRYIDIQSPSRPEVLYRVPAYGQIMCFESGKLTKRLCIYVLGSLPLADKILTLKMMIEADEPEFLKIAHVHPIVRSA